ncbi:hypothetical protein EVJ50_00800 [Synechococcus sp. RSCCF101]|nr:hypothetical protein EVJ50_00800 [Synechococcus sp. RSCCF101]
MVTRGLTPRGNRPFRSADQLKHGQGLSMHSWGTDQSVLFVVFLATADRLTSSGQDDSPLA